MKRQSVKIGDRTLDLDESTIIATTKRVGNIGTLQRQSSFTNKLTIPDTANNLAAVGMSQADDDSEVKYSRQRGEVISNGTTLLPDAEIMIEQVGSRIDVLINAGNSIFFDQISKKKLRDLDMPELDHVWSLVAIASSISHTWADGYIYGIHDTGNQSFQYNNLQCQGLVPQVYAKFLFNRIAAEFGYTMSGAWWEHPMFEKIVVFINDALTGIRIQSQVQIIATKTSSQTFGTLFNTYARIGAYDIVSADIWSVFNNNSINAYEIKFKGKYTFTARVEASLAKTFPGDPLNIVEGRIRLKAVQVVLGVATLLAEQIFIYSSLGAFETTLSIDVELNQDLPESENSGVFVSVEAYQREGQTGMPGIDPYYQTEITVDYCRFSVDSIDADTTHYNRPINIQASLPDWSCGKFIKEICNLAGVIPLVNDYDKTVRLFMLNELAENKSNPYFWQNKIDITTKPQISFKVDGYARTMSFRWAQDERYGYDVSVDNEQLPETVDYIKSDFSYLTPSRILGVNFFAGRMSVWQVDKSIIKFDKKTYIGLIQYKTDELVYTTPNDASFTPLPLTDIPWVYFQNQSSVDFNLSWGFLYNEFYQKVLSGLLLKVFKADILFRLNEFDVAEFDFSIPIYLSSPSGFYFAQAIKEFTTSDQSTTIELIRIG